MHAPPCEPLKECKKETSDRLTTIETDIKEMKSDICAMRDILETWNNTKGFVTTVKVLSKLAIWASVTIGALTAIYHALKHLGQP